MEESSHYQLILRRGREEGRQHGHQIGQLNQARQAILRVGQRRLKVRPPLEVVNDLDSLNDLAKLEQLLDVSVERQSWQVLLPASDAEQPPPK